VFFLSLELYRAYHCFQDCAVRVDPFFTLQPPIERLIPAQSDTCTFQEDREASLHHD
jgi:hypothetical protein